MISRVGQRLVFGGRKTLAYARDTCILRISKLIGTSYVVARDAQPNRLVVPHGVEAPRDV